MKRFEGKTALITGGGGSIGSAIALRLAEEGAAIGVLIGGRFSDVRGRRRIGAVGLVGGAAFTVLRYSQAGWPMWMWGILAGIFGAASVPVMGAFGAELFGTGSRARSNGQITVLGVIGSMIGLQIVGRFTDAGGDFWHVFAMVAGAPLLVALLVLLVFPETAWRELEDLNPEDLNPEDRNPKPPNPEHPNPEGLGPNDPNAEDPNPHDVTPRGHLPPPSTQP